MILCHKCNLSIRDGQRYKTILIGTKTQDQGVLINHEVHRAQTCCMLCDFDKDVKFPKFGCAKPEAMKDWSSRKAAEQLTFDFISVARGPDLRAKLRHIHPQDEYWWTMLSGSEQYIVAKAFDYSF